MDYTLKHGEKNNERNQDLSYMWNCPGYTKPLYFSYIGIFCVMSALFQKVLKRDRRVQVSGEYPKGKF